MSDAKGRLRVDTYRVLSRAVEEGVRYGWRRAHKHVADGEEPDAERAVETIASAVMNEIQEVFKFDEEEQSA